MKRKQALKELKGSAKSIYKLPTEAPAGLFWSKFKRRSPYIPRSSLARRTISPLAQSEKSVKDKVKLHRTSI